MFFENGIKQTDAKGVRKLNPCTHMNKTKIRKSEQPLTVDIEKLSAMLSCGHATAKKIGEQAGARIAVGRRVLYSVEKVQKYLYYLEE